MAPTCRGRCWARCLLGEDLDPLVRDGHLHAVVEADAPVGHWAAQRRHAGHVLDNINVNKYSGSATYQPVLASAMLYVLDTRALQPRRQNVQRQVLELMIAKHLSCSAT